MMEIIERVADREGVDPVDLAVPLYEVIDLHSLDALTDVAGDRQHGAYRRVEFLYYGYTITVDGNGGVTIDEQPLDKKSDESSGEGATSSREGISAELERRERVLRQVADIIADADRSFDEQVVALLELVRDVVGTEYATLSYVDHDTYVFEAIDMPSEVRLEAGETAPLAELPPCEQVIAAERALVVNDLESEAPELADATLGISSYIGVPVFVDDEVYGTFCFYGVESRSEAFSDWDLTVVELIGTWVGGELERRNNERALDAYSAEQPVAD